MKPLRDAVEEYIALRRSLGFKLKETASGLTDFVSFVERKNASHITAELALEWATQRASQRPRWGKRLALIRGFARHWSATDPRTEIPPYGLLPYQVQRARPYFYTDKEIQRLLVAAKELSGGLRPWTYHCLFGLLIVTGLRISEAIHLTREDVDLGEGVLRIRNTKFKKTRLVPLHPSTRDVLNDYASRRDRFLTATSPCFLLNDHGRCLSTSAVKWAFHDLSRRIGLRGPADHTGPRIHDFRHRFALHTLIRWYRNSDDIDRRMPVLSTFLGHTHPADTYWYISVHPELMGLATTKLEQRWEAPHEK